MGTEDDLEEMQRRLEVFSLDMTQRLLKMKRERDNCRKLCKGQEVMENFETIRWEDLCKLYPEDIEPLKRPVVAIGGRLMEPSSILVIGSSDGSVIKGYGMRVAACGWFFYPSCIHNGSAAVVDSSSTLISEVTGVLHLLKSAEEAGIVELLICMDNLSASQFVSALSSGDVLSSRTLQDYVSRSPTLERLAGELKPGLRRLRTLVLVWQKSHVGEKGLFSRMNNSADELAVGRARQLLEEITK